MNIEWKWLDFQNLSPIEQYQMHQLRQKVFVVEQNINYVDADGIDLTCWHLLGINRDSNELIAYLRVVPHLEQNYVKIGRVANASSVRGLGVGRQMMKHALQRIEGQFGNVKMKMNAQSYLEKFYQDFGFIRNGDEFTLEGIQHIEMTR